MCPIPHLFFLFFSLSYICDPHFGRRFLSVLGGGAENGTKENSPTSKHTCSALCFFHFARPLPLSPHSKNIPFKMSFAARALLTPAARAARSEAPAAARRAFSNAAAEEKGGGGGVGLLFGLALVGGGAYCYSQGYLDEFLVSGRGGGVTTSAPLRVGNTLAFAFSLSSPLAPAAGMPPTWHSWLMCTTRSMRLGVEAGEEQAS